MMPRPPLSPSVRRAAATVVLGGGGATLLWAGAVAVLVAQANAARLRIGPLLPAVPAAELHYRPRQGAGHGERPLSLAVLGDSTAAGQGATAGPSTPGALLAQGLADLGGRDVVLHLSARPGATSEELYAQVDSLVAAGARPDVALVLVGANDVVKRVPVRTSASALADTVVRLRVMGAQVVVGTCPDLGSLRSVAQPLRSLAGRWSAQLAAAQAAVVGTCGGRSVALGELLGPQFAASPDDMFAVDRFHPSSAAYERAAEILLPAVAAAAGLLPVEAGPHEPQEPVLVLSPLMGGDPATR